MDPVGSIPVAFLLDHAATVIDFAGPWEAFQDAGEAFREDDGRNRPDFHLYTVAPSADSIETEGNLLDGHVTGLEIVPDYSLDNAPAPKVIVMGAQARRDLPEKLDWIRRVAPAADVVMSVCTGAFLLANAGLLDGLSATTHHDSYDLFEQQFPKVHLLRGRRFVDNGKFVTAGGLTSGVDAALHVVARYYGDRVAARAADYMEHDGDGWSTGLREGRSH